MLAVFSRPSLLKQAVWFIFVGACLGQFLWYTQDYFAVLPQIFDYIAIVLVYTLAVLFLVRMLRERTWSSTHVVKRFVKILPSLIKALKILLACYGLYVAAGLLFDLFSDIFWRIDNRFNVFPLIASYVVTRSLIFAALFLVVGQLNKKFIMGDGLALSLGVFALYALENSMYLVAPIPPYYVSGNPENIAFIFLLVYFSTKYSRYLLPDFFLKTKS